VGLEGLGALEKRSANIALQAPLLAVHQLVHVPGATRLQLLAANVADKTGLRMDLMVGLQARPVLEARLANGALEWTVVRVHKLVLI